ncbi:MAG: YdcF family protein, partial [Ruminococcus sp.]|nr:YdcF family protein [Ruminococcus sp.]
GGLTPLLKGRVDSAAAFEKKQYEQTGKHAVFVPSGGQGADEVMSESEAMKNYLLSIGIPQEQIILENKSENTMQNMQFSKKVIEEHGGEIKDRKIAFATTNYHVFRGYILARKNGFEAKGISAKTKSYFYFNAFLREFIGLLVDQKWNHIVYTMLIVALIVTLNLVG